MADRILWHAASLDEIAKLLRTDPETGLSDRDVAHRMAKQNNSGIWHIRQTSLFRSVIRIVSDAVSVLLLLTALITSLMGQGSFWPVAAILVGCTLIRVILLVRSRQEFFLATRRVFPRVRVLRGGKIRRIGVDRIVDGDVVFLDAGDMVPCDIRLFAADHLVSDERSLDADDLRFSAFAKKEPGYVKPAAKITEWSNMLFASTTVVAGHGAGVAVLTGRRTYVFAKHGGVAINAGEEIPAMDRLDVFCRTMSFLSLAFVVVITFLGLLRGGDDISVSGVFLSALAFCVAAAGECLPAAGQLSLALAVKNAGLTRVSIKDPALVERVASPDTFVIGSPSLIKSGRTRLCAYYAEGAYSEFNTDRRADEPDEHGLSRLLELAYVTTGDVPEAVSSVSETAGGDYEMIRHLHRQYCQPEKVRASAGRFVSAHLPADVASSGGLDTALLRSGGALTAVVSGTPEDVLRVCTTYRTADGRARLTDTIREEIAGQLAFLSHRASAIVGVAIRPSPVSSLTRPQLVRQEMCFVGYFAVSEFLSEETFRFLSDCRKDNLRFVMFSDGAESDRWFATEAGIFSHTDLYLTGEDAPDALCSLGEGQCAVVVADHSPAGEALRARSVAALRTGGRHVAYIDESTAPTDAAAEADVVFAAVPYTPEAMALPQPLSATADAIVSRGSSAGVVSDCVQSTGLCRTAALNLRHAAMYIVISFAAKAVMMLLGAISQLPLLPPVPLLLWGLLLDVFAVLSIIYAVPPRYIFRLAPAVYDTPEILGMMYPLASGILWGLLAMLMPLLGGAAGSSAAVSSVWIGICVGSLAMTAETMQEESMFRSRGRFSRALGILAALTLIGCVPVILSPGAASLLGGSCPSWGQCVLALLAPVLTAAASEIYKHIVRK